MSKPKEEILEKFEMYDVVNLHQVIVYGKNGKIAREFK